MGEESEQLRREIEETRRELGTDVDALTEKVSPSRVVGRRVDKARDAVGGLKEKVMGTTSDASSAGDGISSAASTVGDKSGSPAGSVQGAASSAASTVADTASSTAAGGPPRRRG